MKGLQGVLLVLACLLATTAGAYSIEPKKDIHEALTRAAKHCYDEALLQDSKPEHCPLELRESDDVDMAWIRDSYIPFYNLKQWVLRWSGYNARYPDLEEAVRWPDDPTRQIRGMSVIKFGANMLTNCDRFLSDNPSGRNDINDGLLCNSHVGDMQFLHAQASALDEPAGETYAKVQQWAGFLYKVASGGLSDAELDQDYCRYFIGSTVFDKAMLPSPTATPCEAVKDRPWTLTTLFTFSCPNPLSSVGCKEHTGPSRFDYARINATGALLHLIQDSYSQSHTERGLCEVENGRVLARIDCSPISRFTTYRGQHRHADADRTPRFAESCQSRESIDDPVTASAKVLWHIHRQSSMDDFRKDIERVFGAAPVVARMKPASRGECF